MGILHGGTISVTHLQTSGIKKKVHNSDFENHVLFVAFNNRLVASEKRFAGSLIPAKPGYLAGRTMYFPAGGDLRGWSEAQVDCLRLEIGIAAVQAAAGQGQTRFMLRPAIQLADPVVWHLSCVLRADLLDGSPGGEFLRDTVGSLLAHHIAVIPLNRAARDTERSIVLSPARLRTIRDYVEANLHRQIRLADLAGLAKLSSFHFTRVFKATVGESPCRFVVNQRLTAGRRLLDSTTLPLSAVAEAVGFETVQGFAAAFRRKWGASPGQYRTMMGFGKRNP